MHEIECAVCGKRRKVPPSHYGDNKGKYCSMACFRADKSAAVAKCNCERCGAAFEILASKLKHGKGRYCSTDCMRRHARSTHGEWADGRRGSPTYAIWANMKSRCCNPSDAGFKWYGGRGIAVCERWQTYANFVEDMGERPTGLSIDRIDVNGDYEPENCRWADAFQQNQNRRTSIWVEYGGRRWCQSELARHLGLSYACLTGRIKRGEPKEYWDRPSSSGKLLPGRSRSRARRGCN